MKTDGSIFSIGVLCEDESSAWQPETARPSFRFTPLNSAHNDASDLKHMEAVVAPLCRKDKLIGCIRRIRMQVGEECPVIVYGIPDDPADVIELYRSGVNEIVSDAEGSKDLDGALSFQIETARFRKEELELEQELSREVGDRTRRLSAALDDLRVAYDDTLQALVLALDSREKATGGHSRRVAAYTLFLAILCEMEETRYLHVFRGALLHDIGKIGIPDQILLKPGKLTFEEFETMKTHSNIGNEYLSQVEFLKESIAIPAWHHEKVNGKGYPDGLKGEEIPLEARIFAVIDVYDALVSERPYKKAMSHAEACAIIENDSGTHFDNKIARMFCDIPESVWGELSGLSKTANNFSELFEACREMAVRLNTDQ